jgi:hypothetical protein
MVESEIIGETKKFTCAEVSVLVVTQTLYGLAPEVPGTTPTVNQPYGFPSAAT